MELLADFLTADFLGQAAWLWLTFLAIVGLLLFDLGVLHRKTRSSASARA